RSGTTFCNTLCSHASTNGTTLIQINSDVASSQIEGCSVMTMQTIQQTMFTLKIRFTGFLPKPYFEMYRPPRMNPRLSTPHKVPQNCTLTSDRPYASISAMNTPPRKLLKVVKKMSGRSPGTARTIRMVPFRSILEVG